MNTLPRSAYIHVPFCSQRCGYCNFTLIAGRDDLIPHFLDALAREMANKLGDKRQVDTIFLGGGTPSHLQPLELERLLRLVGQWLELAPHGEYSCEANPLDCSRDRLDVLREHGVNRISLGGQSFNDRKLTTLERDHRGYQLQAAVERCSQFIERVALDLIFAAPGETLADWQQDLQLAMHSSAGHLSVYGLTIERGAAFYGRRLRGQLMEVGCDEQLAMYQWAIKQLTGAGWEHYEVSNFAKPGERCRHNEAYWLGQPWWAFGPGAAGFEHSAEAFTYRRTVNHRSTTSYLQRSRRGLSLVAEVDELTHEDYIRERLVFGLRRLQGVAWSELNQCWQAAGQTGEARQLFEPHVSDFVQRGWLVEEADGIRLSQAGLVISDSLWPDLLSPTAK